MDNLIISKENQGVLTIVLNRLDKKNSLNVAMYNTLNTLLISASNNTDIHCVLITGDSTCFCAGNDLKDFIKSADSGELVAFDFINTLASFNKPLIAAVAGAAVGIGTTLLLHCDMVIAATNSKFKLPFTQLGLCPEAGSSALLTQKLGHNKAFELMVLGETFSAEQALEYGIANHICQPEQLENISRNFADKIAQLPLDSLMSSRKLLKQNSTLDISSAMANEAKEFARLIKTNECKAILTNFFTK